MLGFTDLSTIFLTGLLTGGLTCLAVQGGLLTAVLAQQSRFVKGKAFIPVLVFVLTKLFAYTLVGALLGFLGGAFKINILTSAILQFIVVIFMVGTALHLLNVHPIFRYFVIQPPRFITRLIWKNSHKSGNALFASAFLGALTIFIPCGATQAMMALAVASGNPVVGAVILFTFILGTSPVFALLGYATLKLSGVWKSQFSKVAAVLLLLLAIYNLDGALTLTGTQYTFTNAIKAGYCVVSYCTDVSVVPTNRQTITFTPTGYSPNHIAVKAGEQVVLHLQNSGAQGCLQAFTVPTLRLQQIVLPGQSSDLIFMAPKTRQQLTFTCSMGMYPGTIDVL